TDVGWLVQETRTGGDGSAILKGARYQDCALRVLGPGNIPRVVDSVVLDPQAEPLRVQVEAGARIEGRVRPMEVWHDLQAMAGWEDRAIPEHHRLQLFLHAADGEPRAVFPRSLGGNPHHLGVFADQEGRFGLDGVPSGSWILLLKLQDRGKGYHTQHGVPFLAIAVLVDGETRKLDVDLECLRQVNVQGRVLL